MVPIMNRKKVILLVVSLVLMLSLVAVVSAQSNIADAFTRLSDSFSGFNPAEFYDTAPYIYDAVFLFFLVFTVTFAALKGKWSGGMDGKVALAVAATTTAASIIALNAADRTFLGDSGRLILTVLFLAAAVAAIKLFKENKTLLAATFIMLYFGITQAYPPIKDFIDKIPFLGAIISFALVIALFVALFGLFGAFGKPGEAAEKVGQWWPPSLWNRAKKGAEATANPQAQQAARDERQVNVAEIRVSADMLRRLEDLDRELDKVTQGKSTKDDFMQIETDLKKIASDLRELEGLEHIEMNKEQLRAAFTVRGHATQIEKLTRAEGGILRAFDRLIRDLFDALKEKPAKTSKAKANIKKAKAILKYLIDLNRAEQRALK